LIDLLIHADPGARAEFLASWLKSKLVAPAYDVGRTPELKVKFKKIHYYHTSDEITQFTGTKIRVRPTTAMLAWHVTFFLQKNLYNMSPEFTRDEMSFETYTKLSMFTKTAFDHDVVVDYSWYNHVINFEDTFDTDCLIELYRAVNGANPTDQLCDIMEQTNNINRLVFDKNHAASIVQMVIEREQQLQLDPSQRFWSIVDVYKTTPVDQLYDTVYQLITPKNYGILLV